MTATLEHVAASPRVELRTAPGAIRAQLGVEQFVKSSGLELALLHLIKLRASYINGCAYCVDMHTKDSRIEGESEQRLYAVAVWHETPFFTPRERAALAWTDALTNISETHAPDDVFAEVQQYFTDAEIVALTMQVASINSWNRIAISLRTPVGSYQPAKKHGE